MSENTTTTNNVSTDLEVIGTVGNAAVLDVLREGSSNMISTNRSATWADKVNMFASVQESDDVSAHLGETIWLKDVIAETVHFEAQVDKDGTIIQDASDGARVTLVTADGKSYTASSSVLLKDLGRLFQAAGQPSTWPTPLPIIIKEEGKKPRAYFTVKVDVPAFTAGYKG